MTKLKKGDFIEIDYTGALKDDGTVFDTTVEETAKKHGIANQSQFKPQIICLGEGHVIKGIDDQLIGNEDGKEYTFEITPEAGFGKKDAKLLKIVNRNVFKKQNITPMPGLSVNIDGTVGIIKTVTGGRVVVDFNHPLSGQDLVYTVNVKRVVTDPKEQVKAFFDMMLQQDAQVSVKDDTATVTLPFELPKEIKENLTKKVTDIIKIKNIDYQVEKKGPDKEKV